MTNPTFDIWNMEAKCLYEANVSAERAIEVLGITDEDFYHCFDGWDRVDGATDTTEVCVVVHGDTETCPLPFFPDRAEQEAITHDLAGNPMHHEPTPEDVAAYEASRDTSQED